MNGTMVLENRPDISPDQIRIRVQETMNARVEQITAVVSVKSADVTAFINALPLPAIKDQATYDVLVDSGKKAKALNDDLEELRTSFTKPINDGLDDINALFKPDKLKLKNISDSVTRNANAWNREQAEKRAQEDREREEIARKERERLDAEARKQREKEAEARRVAEEAERKAAEEKDAEKRKLLQAEADRKNREAEKARTLAETKESMSERVVAPIPPPIVNKGGIYSKDVWTVEIKSKKDFIQWAIAHDSLEYLLIDEKLLNKEAQSTKGVRQWPGVTVKKGYGGGMKTK